MRVYAAMLLTAATMLGCGGPSWTDSLPELVPVSGQVTLDQKPLAKATLQFIPIGSSRGHICTAITDDNGRYEAMAAETHKGLPVGEFQVVCNKWVLADGSDLPPDTMAPPWEIGAKELLPPRYSDETRSQLKAIVPPGGGTIDFALKLGR